MKQRVQSPAQTHTETLTATERRHAQRALLAWFERARRSLPWRTNPSPYATWISEAMLQQTQVATVIPFYNRFIKSYPSVSALAKAREHDVLKLWEGLGYYSRARNLLRGAQTMVTEHNARVPSDASVLRGIPGIGRYTAGAIASIAYRQPEPILDGNIMRVLCRWFDISGDPRRPPINARLWSLAGQLVTNTDPARLNESLMELGAIVCTPAKPRCADCPLLAQCRAHARGVVELLPTPTRRAATAKRTVAIAVFSKDDELLLKQQRAAAAHWAKLWTFPFIELQAAQPSDASSIGALVSELGVQVAHASVLTRGTYSITRFRFSFVAIQALVEKLPRRRLPPGYAWVRRADLAGLAMPAPHRRLARKL